MISTRRWGDTMLRKALSVKSITYTTPRSAGFEWREKDRETQQEKVRRIDEIHRDFIFQSGKDLLFHRTVTLDRSTPSTMAAEANGKRESNKSYTLGTKV